MKPNHLFTSTLVATALFVASCSTSRLANNTAGGDDVYNTTAQAKEYKPAPVYQNRYVDTAAADSYTGSDSEYDMDYASRIDRFYYGNPNRAYYDPYYNYYGYNSFYDPFGYSLGGYFGYSYNNWFNPYSNWGYYGSPYYSNFWGPYSYYGGGYFGGGFYGGGYYGGGYGGGYYAGRNNENYRPRPTRGVTGTARPGDGYNVPSRGNAGNTAGRPNRPQSYNPATGGNGAISGRPTRGTGTTTSGTADNARPTRTTESRPAPTYTPPRESSAPPRSYSPPPSSSGGGNSGGGGGGARPTRGGGRG